jgi:hypothetical protein
MKTIINIIILLFVAGFPARAGLLKRDPVIPASERNKRDLVQRIYNAEIGVRERTGYNDGWRVEEYLRYVKLKKGDPWCAAFVCWVFGKAGIENPRTGWSPGLFTKSRVCWQRTETAGLNYAGRRSGITSVPKQGDVFGIWFPDKQRIAHVGFVDKWEDTWVTTVEGNTNEAGSREGDGVYRKRRLTRSVWKVARWIKEPETNEKEGRIIWKHS